MIIHQSTIELREKGDRVTSVSDIITEESRYQLSGVLTVGCSENEQFRFRTDQAYRASMLTWMERCVNEQLDRKCDIIFEVAYSPGYIKLTPTKWSFRKE